MGRRKKGDTLDDITNQISRIVNGDHKVITNIRVASAGSHRRYANSAGCGNSDISDSAKLFGPPSSEAIIAGSPSATNAVNVFEAASVHSDIGRLLKTFASHVVDLFVKGPQYVAEFAAEWAETVMPTVPQKYQYEMQGFATLFSFLFYQVAQAHKKYLDALHRAALPTSVDGIEALIRSLTVMKDSLAAAAAPSDAQDTADNATDEAAVERNVASGSFAADQSGGVRETTRVSPAPPRRSPVRARPWRDKSLNAAKAEGPGGGPTVATAAVSPSRGTRFQMAHQEPSVSTFQMHLDLTGANPRQEYDPEEPLPTAASWRHPLPHPPAKRTGIPTVALVQSAEEGVRSGQLPPAALSTGALLQSLLVTNAVVGAPSAPARAPPTTESLPLVLPVSATDHSVANVTVPILRGGGGSWAASVGELKPILFSPRLPDEARLRSPLRGEAAKRNCTLAASLGSSTAPFFARKVDATPPAQLPREAVRSTVQPPPPKFDTRINVALEVPAVAVPCAVTARSWKEFWETEDRKRLQQQLGVATVTNFRARDLVRYGEDMEKLRNEVLGHTAGPSSRGLVLEHDSLL